MRDHRPHLLPKLVSEEIRGAMTDYPCTLRIASFIPGLRCDDRSTTVGCHTNTPGKGISTKSTDFSIAAGCRICHDLIDRVDDRISYIEDRYPAALENRMRQGIIETLTLLWMDGLIIVPSAKQ